MAADGSLDVDTFTPVWTAGWQWPWAVVLALMLGGNFLLAADRPLLGTAVLFGGPALAVAGVRAVSAESAAVRRAAVEKIRATAAETVGVDPDDPSVYTLSGGRGSVVGLDAAKRYETTVLFVGESSVSVHDGEVNLLATSWRLADDAETLACDRIDEVTYSDGAVVVSLDDGTRRTYPSDSRPTDALAALAAASPSAAVV
ncbi:hypothetical protein [Salinirubrum litoreum]|uniref:PH domain-containing protein n=1 Tax=Salinirubrum litoreum TaxID=1126234 RepID=A0ABD5RGJ1_9EURY|nr:hypothetical protein [Salinirubrum litoreum]